jgi:hypothetical protein
VDPRDINSVAAVPDTTVDIGAIRLASFENENYAAWPHSRRLYLNTTSAGAGVAGNVDDFPVLVRLTADDFDFSRTSGADIRFSDMKGKRLRFEVERWDSAAARAEIWVRVDRVQGNSSSQFITLHWGLAGSYDGANLALYVDGKPVAKAAADGLLDYRFWPGFVLGKHGNRKVGYGFIGNLDQVEIGGEGARSADWIKLAYENQREAVVWVEFR